MIHLKVSCGFDFDIEMLHIYRKNALVKHVPTDILGHYRHELVNRMKHFAFKQSFKLI